MGISTPSFMKKYFMDEEITKLQKKNALHTGQFNELILIYELMEHLNRSGVSTKLLSIEKTNDYYSSKFHRIYTKGTREIRHRLMGHGFFD